MSKVLEGVDEIRHRSNADRPSPAIPLLLLALVVTGALVVALLRAAQVQFIPTDASGVVVTGSSPTDGSASTGMLSASTGILMGPDPMNDRVRLLYWVIASVVAYLLALWIARRQGYHRGLWVNRRPLVAAGLVALAGAVIIVIGWYAPGDLLIRGNVPLLAIAVGIVVWAIRERRPGLWIVAAVIVPLSLLANLYNMENVLFRLGIPVFGTADEVANLGSVAVALLVAAAAFGLLHRREARALPTRGAR